MRKTLFIIALCFSPLILAKEVLHFNAQTIDVMYGDNFSQKEKDITQRWLLSVSNALLTVYGELPKDHFVIKVSKTSRASRSPVPWGQVRRTTPNQVQLTIDPARGYKALINDWTLFHELSHLLIPYRGYGNLWLSEGLASYYQNIIQGRAGHFSEQKVWLKLIQGFERGKRNGTSKLSLEKASEQLRQSGEYMRVYWSGALFWLNVDIALRSGDKTLDGFLKYLKSCCEQAALSSEQIIQRLVDYGGSDSFSKMYVNYQKSRQMPAYHSLLSSLGITLSNSQVSINNNQKLSNIRKAITQGGQ